MKRESKYVHQPIRDKGTFEIYFLVKAIFWFVQNYLLSLTLHIHNSDQVVDTIARLFTI